MNGVVLVCPASLWRSVQRKWIRSALLIQTTENENTGNTKPVYLLQKDTKESRSSPINVFHWRVVII